MVTVNIRDEELIRKIQQLAQRQNQDLDQTVTEIVRRELSSSIFDPPLPSGVPTLDTSTPDEYITYWVQRTKRPTATVDASQQIDEELYDESGLPK